MTTGRNFEEASAPAAGRDITLLDIAERLGLSRDQAKEYVLAAAAVGGFPAPKVELPLVWIWTASQAADVEAACVGLELSLGIVADARIQLQR